MIRTPECRPVTVQLTGLGTCGCVPVKSQTNSVGKTVMLLDVR
jgi:hypothetical protein